MRGELLKRALRCALPKGSLQFNRTRKMKQSNNVDTSTFVIIAILHCTLATLSDCRN